jgi:DNA adenine methylase
MNAPFPYFGGKRDIADVVWVRLGSPRQYIEPFCGSAAVLLAAPRPASLEVVGDLNGFIANFWRAVVAQHAEVARWADYPVSHIDLGARHRWLMAQRDRIGAALQDPLWPGDPQVAGWWLWGQCAWIGSGWCEWLGKVPHVSDAGMGVQALGQVPHVSDAGRGVWTTGGATALRWLGELAARLERVRVVHGEWSRCLNNHYGGPDTAIFFDPPYDEYEGVYRASSVAQDVAEWCVEHGKEMRIALCGHRGDYQLEGWVPVDWTRKRLTYSGATTRDRECVWFSPVCLDPDAGLLGLFGKHEDVEASA